MDPGKDADPTNPPAELSVTRAPGVFEFADLPRSDLLIDALYRGGRRKNAGDDPLSPLLSVSNMGGFRYRGSLDNLELVVLTTSMTDPDWPDAIDQETGIFTYYGDNKSPGQELHATRRFGNEILRRLFDMAHGGREQRRNIPPILVFTSARTWRDAIFVGLAVPGTSDLRASEDLVAVWKIADGRRFQNYRARFTILNVPMVSRAWINDIVAGRAHSPSAPKLWTSWIDQGERKPLLATRSIEHRKKSEQLPHGEEGRAIVRLIHEWFEGGRVLDFV